MVTGDHARLLEEVVVDLGAPDLAVVLVEVDVDELAEPAGVVVARRLGVPEGLQQRVRREDLRLDGHVLQLLPDDPRLQDAAVVHLDLLLGDVLQDLLGGLGLARAALARDDDGAHLEVVLVDPGGARQARLLLDAPLLEELVEGHLRHLEEMGLDLPHPRGEQLLVGTLERLHLLLVELDGPAAVQRLDVLEGVDRHQDRRPHLRVDLRLVVPHAHAVEQVVVVQVVQRLQSLNPTLTIRSLIPTFASGSTLYSHSFPTNTSSPISPDTELPLIPCSS